MNEEINKEIALFIGNLVIDNISARMQLAQVMRQMEARKAEPPKEEANGRDGS